MQHLAFELLLRRIGYPVLYWIGFAATKAVSRGNAIIQPYSELGAEEDAAWWEFRLRRWGYKEWRPESMVIIGTGVVFLVVSGYYIFRYLT